MPRVRIWWLMVLVAIVALGCWAIPAWWRWHHQMLDWSETWLAVAAKHEAQARLARQGVLSATDANARAISAEIAADLERRAEQCRWCAAFPWLDLNE